MQCRSCHNPLHIISGGNKSEEGSTVIKTVHVWGCLNPDCKDAMVEQTRTETEQESFNG